MLDSLTAAPDATRQDFLPGNARGSNLLFRIVGTHHAGQLISLNHEKCTIGSSLGCVLALRSRFVHPLHCLVLRGPGGVLLRAFGTDTRVNGEAVQQKWLCVGDRLSVGPVDLELLETGYEDDGAETSLVDESRPSVGQTLAAEIRAHEHRRTRNLIQELKLLRSHLHQLNVAESSSLIDEPTPELSEYRRESQTPLQDSVDARRDECLRSSEYFESSSLQAQGEHVEEFSVAGTDHTGLDSPIPTVCETEQPLAKEDAALEELHDDNEVREAERPLAPTEPSQPMAATDQAPGRLEVGVDDAWRPAAEHQSSHPMTRRQRQTTVPRGWSSTGPTRTRRRSLQSQRTPPTMS